jgi:hypothetical protein
MVNVTHVTLQSVFLISCYKEYAQRLVFLQLPGYLSQLDGLAETVETSRSDKP